MRRLRLCRRQAALQGASGATSSQINTLAASLRKNRCIVTWSITELYGAPTSYGVGVDEAAATTVF